MQHALTRRYSPTVTFAGYPVFSVEFAFSMGRCPQCRIALDAPSLGFELEDEPSSDTDLSDTDVDASDGDVPAHHLLHRVAQRSRLRFGRARPLSAGQASAPGRDSALHNIMRRLRWPISGGDGVARGNPASFLRRSFG
jgi:hypothetical protein